MKNKSFYPHFIVKDGIHGLGVFTTVAVSKGRVLFKLKGEILPKPTRTSIQIAEHKHVEDPIGAHINHSCEPTARVDKWMRAFIAVRDIQPDEEITFDYSLNEDVLAFPFQCHCCERKILGRKKVLT